LAGPHRPAADAAPPRWLSWRRSSQGHSCCQLRVLRTRARRRARCWGGERSRRAFVFAENFLVLPGLLPEHPRRLPERAVGWAPRLVFARAVLGKRPPLGGAAPGGVRCWLAVNPGRSKYLVDEEKGPWSFFLASPRRHFVALGQSSKRLTRQDRFVTDWWGGGSVLARYCARHVPCGCLLGVGPALPLHATN
jgi:hypothetical protein